MCGQDDETLDLPPAVIEALAHYRRLRDEHGWDWGEEDLPDFFRWARFSRLGDLLSAVAETGDRPAAVRRVVTDDPPAGVVLVRVPGGRITVGPRRLAIPGRPVTLDVVVDSSSGRQETLTVAGRAVTVAPHAAEIEVVDLEGAAPLLRVEHDAEAHAVEVAEPVAAAELRLRSGTTARWSVTDPRGGAWFPEGLPHKWDAAHRPYFHAADVTLVVPDTEMHLRCARGPEFGIVERTVHPGRPVTTDPPRLVDPAAEGWFGGDLHVHLDYSGDLVITPEQGAVMQAGEGLHLLNLTAGNLSGARVYDRELLEHTVGRDLWADDDRVARAGVEFRNDLLGHVHALAPSGPPARYQTGHPGTLHPHDHPPDAVACADLRRLDAAVAYAHPAFAPFADPDPDPDPDGETPEADDEDPEVGEDGPFGSFFAPHRTVEARELVVDAAPGLVDAMDVVSCFDDRAAAFLYRRLLNCGLAHTTPVHVDVGARVARSADARWCLGFLDRLEVLVTEQGRFDPEDRDAQLGDLVALLDRARAVYRAAAA